MRDVTSPDSLSLCFYDADVGLDKNLAWVAERQMQTNFAR